uniref:Dickkopf N-terminal cysteine-rich domain-containing protein n=1 Tax=Rhizophagus clarus TaxID=94130 RepID=A0A140D0B8_9GLOM|nr:hypothetical protein [Rhizophagus clarus]
MKIFFSTFVVGIISCLMLCLALVPVIEGDGKRDCHSGFSCSSNNDCIFKNCENFVCVRNLVNGCKVGGQKHNCKLGDPCVTSDDCNTPGCEANDNGDSFCV